MTDELTNPEVLAALEIAPVEFDDENGYLMMLAAMAGRAVVLDMPERWYRDATPADLDHALKEWLGWLAKKATGKGLGFGEMPFGYQRNGDCWFVQLAHTTPVLGVVPARIYGASLLLAVAAAVVKVGKENEDG